MGARLYDPHLGRFLEVDPVAGGSANSYDYCSADPVNGLDLAGTYVTESDGGGPSPVEHKVVTLGVTEHRYHGLFGWTWLDEHLFDASVTATFAFDGTKAWVVGQPRITHFVPQEGFLSAEFDSQHISTSSGGSVTLDVDVWKLDLGPPDHFINLHITVSPTGGVTLSHDEGDGNFINVGF
jgi:hypothetical protein